MYRLFLIIILALAFQTSYAQNASSAKETILQAIKLYNDGQYNESINKLSCLVLLQSHKLNRIRSK
jgi:preprotein translocase subunit SecG